LSSHLIPLSIVPRQFFSAATTSQGGMAAAMIAGLTGEVKTGFAASILTARTGHGMAHRDER